MTNVILISDGNNNNKPGFMIIDTVLYILVSYTLF